MSKWQPFVPNARANAQLIVDDNSGAAIDVIFTAGVQVGNEVKFGEIFATHPGHHFYELEHYIHSNVIVAETRYDELTASWSFELLADARKENFLRLDFARLDDAHLSVRLTAVNHSRAPAAWHNCFLASPNAFCREAVVESASIRCGDTFFSVDHGEDWFSIPVVKGNTKLWGMLIHGDAENRLAGKRFMNCCQTWEIAPGSAATQRLVFGDIRKQAAAEIETTLSRHTVFPANPADEMIGMVEHLANQIKLNRVYPPTVKYQGKPAAMYIPAAVFDHEYFWDAGAIAIGLTEVDEKSARECISQYLPFSPATVFPHFYGSLSLLQASAAWALYQKTLDRAMLRDLYAGLHELFMYCSGQKNWPVKLRLSDGRAVTVNLDPDGNGLISPQEGGSGLDDTPSQIWTRGYGVEWARQSAYWAEPFEVNPTAGLLRTASVNMTAFALLSAKLLKQICAVVEIETPEVYDRFITKSENSLREISWNPETGHFHWTVIGGTHQQCPYYDLSGLTPLFSASYAGHDQRRRLIAQLKERYLTSRGLTTVDPKADFYRVGYWCGAVWAPFHWFFWKSLLGMGEIQLARKVAGNLLNCSLDNYRRLDLCYEKFDLETGRGCGSFTYGGLASPLLNLWAGYRKPGSVNTGFFVTPLTREIDPDGQRASLEFHSEEQTEKTAVLVVLRPDASYRITTGADSWRMTSDPFGLLEIELTNRRKLALQIEIERTND